MSGQLVPAPPQRKGMLPLGRYDFLSARRMAKSLGHLALPGFLPRRYEVVVGLTESLADALISICREELGDALIALWISGSRVMTRPRLRLVDPSVFSDREGTLRIENKHTLRELGPDPTRSSDLDLKILVRDRAMRDGDLEAIGRHLGARAENEGYPIPISGHRSPLLRVWRVPESSDPRAAFAHYNRDRMRSLGKGPLSLHASVLLHPGDRSIDPTASVRACLIPRAGGGRAVAIDSLDVPLAQRSDPARFRQGFAGLDFHTLTMALIDFPELEPPSIRADGARIIDGLPGVLAALEAGRSHVCVE